jgi:hypothetical protein
MIKVFFVILILMCIHLVFEFWKYLNFPATFYLSVRGDKVSSMHISTALIINGALIFAFVVFSVILVEKGYLYKKYITDNDIKHTLELTSTEEEAKD